MKALFIVDNRPEAGLGHVVRSGALSDELERRGWLSELWGTANFPADSVVNVGDDLDVLVLDIPPSAPFPGSVSRNAELTVVAIIDEPRECTGVTEICPACSHAMLRREFAEARWDYLPIHSRPEGIAYLRDISGLSAAQLVSAIGCHKLAITYGGQRALECMCLGTPVVVIPRNEGERLIAKAIVEHGAGVQADADDAEAIAKELVKNLAVLQVMSERARSLVDGKGCERVAEEIEHLCSRG